MWTKADVRRVSGETLLSEGTVERWLRGGPTRPTSIKLITEAAARLGLSMPTPEELGERQRVA